MFVERLPNPVGHQNLMTMKIIFFTLTILVLLDGGYTGDEELKKKAGNGKKARIISPRVNQTVLDVYYATDPLKKGQQGRINNKLSDGHAKSRRQCALYYIRKMCKEWPQLTGLERKETDEILDKIYSETRTDGPVQESEIREKLLEVRPELQRIHPEYIRSVVHDWYRSRLKAIEAAAQIRSRNDQADLLYTYHQVKSGEGYIYDRLADRWERFHPDLYILKKLSLLKKATDLTHVDPPFTEKEMEKAKKRYERVFGEVPAEATQKIPIKRDGLGKIRTRIDEADLLYTYNQVRIGDGIIQDRLAEKWKQFHPLLNDYSKATLFRKANDLSNANPGFSAEEMEAAQIRYEKMFRSGDAASRRRAVWTEEQEADLLYLLDKYKRKELDIGTIAIFWRALHPEFASVRKRVLFNELEDLERRKITLTPEEETAAQMRLMAAFARNQQSYQDIVITGKGKLPATQSSPRQELYQQTSDWMIHSPPHHNDLQLTQEERNDPEMRLNERTLNHPPTPRYFHTSYHHGGISPPVLSLFPVDTTHSHLSPSTPDPHTVNPYYEHGSSSHSLYNPDNTNPNYEHGGSSHSHYNPHP